MTNNKIKLIFRFLLISSFLLLMLQKVFEFQWIITFFILMYLPGDLILDLLGKQFDNLSSYSLFTIGISIFCIIISGLTIDTFGKFLGVERTLSPKFLGVGISVILFSLTLICYKKAENKGFNRFNIKTDLSKYDFFVISNIIFLFIYALFSIVKVRYTGSNIFLPGVYLIILFIFVFSVYKNDKLNPSMNKIIVLSIALSMTTILVFRSRFFFGDDIYSAIATSKINLINLSWSIPFEGLITNPLSITLLIPSLSSLLRTNIILSYKLMILLVVSFTPLIVYKIVRKYMNRSLSLIGAFFYMSSIYFVIAGSGFRTQIAIFFVGLFVLHVVKEKNISANNKLLMIFFLFMICVSHYATSFAFLLMIIIAVILKKVDYKNNFKSILNAKVVIYFALVNFIWHGIIAPVPFEFGTEMSYSMIFGLREDRGIGKSVAGTGGRGILRTYLPIQIEWILLWFILIGITIGALILIKNKLAKKKKSQFLTLNSYYFYFVIASGSISVLLLLPGFDPGMNLDRYWGAGSIFFIIPLLVGFTINNKRKIGLKKFFVVLVLIIYFLSLTGVTYMGYEGFDDEMPDYLKGRSLTSENESFHHLFHIHHSEVNSASWLLNHSQGENIYGDDHPKNSRSSYRIYASFALESTNLSEYENVNNLRSFSNYTIDELEDIEGYLYLRRVNVKNREYTTTHKLHFDDFMYEEVEDNMSAKIYSNGYSEVFKG